MKKKLFAAALVVTLLCAIVCIAACGGNTSLKKFNDALKNPDYTHVTVNVTSSREGVELNGTYNVTFDGENATVEYAFDKLNELSVDGNNPDDYITRVTGSVTVTDGKITDGDGSEIELGQFSYTGFYFKENFFDDIKSGTSTFRAKVMNPQGFVGNAEFVGTNMRVEAVLSGEAMSKLELTYFSAGGFDTTVTYLFTVAQAE